MGNGYDRQSINHLHQFHQKTIFLPMFCRLSIKDIKLNHRRKHPTTADEPTSPKVSCMGQVKRNNRVIGFPSGGGAAASTSVSTRHHRYSKLKKLFSSKTLLPPATSSIPAAGWSGSKSCRNSREMCASDRRRLKLKNDGDHKCEQDFSSKVVNVGQLDPPLPVVKKVAPPEGCSGGEVNIWKRRFNGTTLKSLQIERANLPNSNSQLPPTV